MMLESILLGGGFAFAAVAQPGPLQAFLLARVAAIGWRRVLPAALSPLVSDGPIALTILLVLQHLPATALRILQAAGGVLLLYLAWSTLRQWRAPADDTSRPEGSAPRTLLQAVAVNFLNPGPYLGWSLILGPAVLKAWSRGPALAVALVAAFYGTMVTMLAATIVLFGATRWLGPRGQRLLLLLSALALAALGIYRLAAAFFPGVAA
jgi:threonine/homoserine/homoserine lactone efflux protein